jgi:hypothetical protein
MARPRAYKKRVAERMARLLAVGFPILREGKELVPGSPEYLKSLRSIVEHSSADELEAGIFGKDLDGSRS